MRKSKLIMEQSDDDTSDEDSSDNDMLAHLPCDLPMWPDICVLPQELELCRTSSDIGRVIAKLDEIVNTTNFDCAENKVNTIEYFLEEVSTFLFNLSFSGSFVYLCQICTSVYPLLGSYFYYM